MSGAPKVSIFEMVLWAQARADALDGWERVHHGEGGDMPEYMQREREVARAAAATLTVVFEFKDDLIALVRGKREAQKRARAIMREDREEAAAGAADGQ